MWQKILALAVKSLIVAPKVLADTSSAVSKIQADAGLTARIHDGLDAALALLSDIEEVL